MRLRHRPFFVTSRRPARTRFRLMDSRSGPDLLEGRTRPDGSLRPCAASAIMRASFRPLRNIGMRDSIFRALAFGLSIAASAATAGCSISSTADPAVGSGPSNASAFAVPFGGSMDSLAGPALIAVDEDTGALQTYEMQPGGNNRPRPISKPGIFGYGGLVGNGRVIVGLTQNPSGIVEYDTTSHAVKTIADPNGTPVDIA